CFGVDLPFRQTGRAAADRGRQFVNREGTVGKLQARLEAALKREVRAQLPLVLQVQTNDLVVDIAAVLRDQRIARALIGRARVVDVERVPAAGGVRYIVLEPQAGLDAVRSQVPAQRRDPALSVDLVLGGACRVVRSAKHGFQVLLREVDLEQRRQAGLVD